MFNSEALEVAIGMVFLFLLMSVVCTAVREWLEGFLKWRASDLEHGLRTLLDDRSGAITKDLFDHPMINSLFKGTYGAADRNLPSYIPAANFATAFLDYVARGAMTGAPATGSPAPNVEPLTIQSLRDGVATLPSEHLRRFVLATLDYAGNDIEKARLGVQQWFDGTMDRVSGWYKRRTQAMLFALGLGTAIALNVDSLYVIQRLISDKTLRTAVATQADGLKAIPACTDNKGQCIEDTRAALLQIGMPIGWVECRRHGDSDAHTWPRQVCAETGAAGVDPAKPAIVPNVVFQFLGIALGWFVTAFAVMLGAPFWFDVLNRFMVIRSTVKPHEKSPEEDSQDRSADKKAAVVADPSSTPAVDASAAAAAADPPAPPDPPSALPITDAVAAFVPHQWQAGRENPQEIVL